MSSPALSSAWRTYRLEEPGSIVPSDPLPDHRLADPTVVAAEQWALDPPTGLLVVSGGSFLSRQAAGFAAVPASLLGSGTWRGYWTAADYSRNYGLMDDNFKLARASSASQDVLNQAYAYETRLHDLEAEDWLFLDRLSECHLTPARASSLFDLVATRAASAKFRTVVSVASLEASVSQHDAARAFQSLFEDPFVATVVA
jgi:hypothetical protein